VQRSENKGCMNATVQFFWVQICQHRETKSLKMSRCDAPGSIDQRATPGSAPYAFQHSSRVRPASLVVAETSERRWNYRAASENVGYTLNMGYFHNVAISFLRCCFQCIANPKRHFFELTVFKLKMYAACLAFSRYFFLKTKVLFFVRIIIVKCPFYLRKPS